MKEILIKYTKWLNEIYDIDVNEPEGFAIEFLYDHPEIEAQYKAENLPISDVVGQSEQLKAFREWTRENLNQEDVVTQKAVDGYLESL